MFSSLVLIIYNVTGQESLSPLYDKTLHEYCMTRQYMDMQWQEPTSTWTLNYPCKKRFN